MPPKKDAAAGADPASITGFEARETKLIAAAFVSSLGLDKYDYDLMATLTGNTAGSLKKMWPVVKRKVIELHPSYGAFLGASGSKEDVKAAPKAAPKGKKRKTPDTENEASPEDTEPVPEAPKGKKGPAKGKGGRPKKVKKEVNSDNDGGQDVDQDEESDNEI